MQDVDKNMILIDNQDIMNASMQSLRENISFVPQDPSLFHRTIYENIACAKLNATQEEVMQASIKAKVDEFVQTLPDKYNTLVGERGLKLSGGQRQRIAIARALLKNAPIFIMDEATSQLDSITEEVIKTTLIDFMAEKTSIVIAHRLSTVVNMDRIVVFDNGIIVQDGTHNELISQDGVYNQFWKLNNA